MIRHRIGTCHFDIATRLQLPQLELVPDIAKFSLDFELGKCDLEWRTGYLDETSGTKLHRFIGGQPEHNFADQGTDITRLLDLA